MNCEVVAVGTELLLGQIVDTNSAWIGEQLALAGIDSYYQTRVGDNLERMTAALRQALDRSDAVIVCGGLGPTPDDITREAVAAVLGVELRRDDEVAERIGEMFVRRGRHMPESNLRQADVPAGAQVMDVHPGTAPGLICPVRAAAPSRRQPQGRDKVLYAVPGVPWEMRIMVGQCVLPDLQRRAGSRRVIRSRTLRTWGFSESDLAERLDPEIRRLDATGEATIAFLASGVEGIKVRVTAKAVDDSSTDAILAAVEERVRAVIGGAVFGVDDDTMESVVLDMMRSRGLKLGLAESVTGGLMASRLTAVAGASDVLLGTVVAYDRSVKTGLLGAPDVNAVSEEMALSMAAGVCRVLGADVGLTTTGAAGPQSHEGAEPGTVWIGLHITNQADAAATSRATGRAASGVADGVAADVAAEGVAEAVEVRFTDMDRDVVRQLGTITALNLLRTRLQSRPTL
ncbi:MAG: CinA family nicotinamide mononucleotide deamidase-related protein [Acidimicrobiaceae bacterium]|nr:CinA family nicotinamide mononucleotide deamidase-related protein [Acidimicrobiaceae bacterium]